MGFGVVGLEREGTVEGRERLVAPAELAQQVAEIVEGARVSGAQRDGALVGRERLVAPARRQSAMPRLLQASA